MNGFGENNSEKLRQEAMAQTRALRRKLEAEHPELIASLRKNLPSLEKQASALSVDRRKNIESVMQFLKICPNPNAFRGEIRAFLAESRD